jgi:hypothetical protein
MNFIQNNLKPLPVMASTTYKVLRPLVKLLIKNGMTFPFLMELLKEVYVEVADNDFKIEGKEQTDSRINFLTGIHRKDVKRLRGEYTKEAAPTIVSLGAQIVAKWIGDESYLDSNGKPLGLAKLKKAGGDQSFEALVMSVNKDIKSRAVLDDWLNLNIVSINKENLVCLNTDSFIPEQGIEEKLWFFGENLHDHISAASHNVSNGQPVFLERAVFYDQLSASSTEELGKLAKQSGSRLINKINKKAMALQSDDSAKDNHSKRMRFGVYFYQEDEITGQSDD